MDKANKKEKNYIVFIIRRSIGDAFINSDFFGILMLCCNNNNKYVNGMFIMRYAGWKQDLYVKRSCLREDGGVRGILKNYNLDINRKII